MEAQTPFAYLALCTRVHAGEAFDRTLREWSTRVEDWARVGQLAEVHSMAPLLMDHLNRIGAALPREVKRPLQAQTIRQKAQYAVQADVLVKVLQAFEAEGITAVALKGSALRQLVYPKPWLRPMNDIDLLVKRSHIRQAQQLLGRLGFYAPIPPENKPLPDKHLEMAVKTVNGVAVGIELHYNLYDSVHPASFEWVQRKRPSLNVLIKGQPVQTLGYEEMLWHLCEHLSYHATIWEPIRFIWVADIIGFAEKFVDEIDWEFVEKAYPLILKRLSLFHSMTPLSSRLLAAAPIKIGGSVANVGEEYDGWLRHSFSQQSQQGFCRGLKKSLVPSEWWLRLHYQLDSVQPCFWHRWVLHPIYVLGPLYLAEKVKLLWHKRIVPRILNQMQRREFNVSIK